MAWLVSSIAEATRQRTREASKLRREAALAPGKARLLLRRADGGGRLAATHQDLAVELGTAREVVSRLLKDFESRGLVRLGRGEVDLLDTARLRALGAEER